MSAQTIIVTGGNRGIGFDVCRKLAHAGNNVILCSRNLAAGNVKPKLSLLLHLSVIQKQPQGKHSSNIAQDDMDSDFLA